MIYEKNCQAESRGSLEGGVISYQLSVIRGRDWEREYEL